MDDNENEIPGKRPKMRNTIDELKEQITSKNNEIDVLKEQFKNICEENKKLRADLDELLKKLNSADSCEEYTTDEEMVTENEPSQESASNDDAGGNHINMYQQNANIASVLNQAVKMVPNVSAASSSNKNISNSTLFREAPKVLPGESKNSKDGSNQKKPNARREGSSKSVPIITTYNINVKNISSLLSKALGHDEYNINILSKHVTNIGVCSLEDFDKLKNLLKEQKIDFYTYTPKSQRPFSVVVKGLSDTFDNNEVLEYMQSLQINIRIIGLHKLGGDKWLFQIGRESDIRAFRNIRYILHCRVKMARRNRRNVVQCYNCQRFGHVAINCNMPYRCVKCSGDHGPGKCVIPPRDQNTVEVISTDRVTGQAIRTIGFPVKCANCGVEGHTASAKECPKRQELLRKIAARKDSKVNDRKILNASSNGRVSGISYAAAAKAGGAASNSGDCVTLESAGAEFDIIDRDCRRLFGSSLLSCLGKIRGFAKDYRSLSNDEERSRALLGMLISLHQDG